MSLTRAVLALAVSFAVPSALAQEPAPQADGGVVVEAAPDDSQVTSQVASYAVTKLKDSPAVVTVVTAEEIRESGARDLTDLLYLVPGFFIGVDTQGVVGPGFRGMWGYEGKILLMIDGKEMNELLYSTLQLGNEFPTELIERVEVVRGPGSVIYGGNAELAVINIITRGVQGATDLQVSGNYGQMTGGPDFGRSYGRRGGSLSARYVFDAVPGLSAFASGSIGQGQRSVRDYTDSSGVSASMAGASALDPATVQAGIGFRDIQATFLFHRLATSTISGTGDTVTAPVPTVFESYHGELIGSFRPTDRFEIIPRLNLTYQRPWRTPDQTNAFYYDKTGRRLRARLIARWAPLDALQLTVGGDAMFDTAWLNGPPDIGLQTSFGGNNQVDYRTFAGFVELFSENPIVNVAAGARYDNNSAVGGALAPRVVLLRSFGPVGLKALFSLAFRWPGFENLNLNPALQPERTLVFEFEAGWDITKNIRLSANYFDVGIGSPIVFSSDPNTMQEAYFNLGRQGTRGVDVGFRAKGTYGRVDASYSFYAPSQRDNIPNYEPPLGGGRLASTFLAAPAHRASVTGAWKPLDWLSIGPTLLVLGPRYTLGPPTMAGDATPLEVPAQVMANLVVRVDNVPFKGLGVSLGVYNIAGTDFRYLQPYSGGHAPLPGLDREILLKVSYLFEPSGD